MTVPSSATITRHTISATCLGNKPRPGPKLSQNGGSTELLGNTRSAYNSSARQLGYDSRQAESEPKSGIPQTSRQQMIGKRLLGKRRRLQYPADNFGYHRKYDQMLGKYTRQTCLRQIISAMPPPPCRKLTGSFRQRPISDDPPKSLANILGNHAFGLGNQKLVAVLTDLRCWRKGCVLEKPVIT